MFPSPTEAAKPQQVQTPHARLLFTSFHSRMRAIMLLHTRKRPSVSDTNSSHKSMRDAARFSTRSTPAQKSHTKCRTKKTDVLPHEPARCWCNNVQQREMTKQVNISAVRRRTRIHDAQLAAVSQKKTYNAGAHEKCFVLKYADSQQPL